MNTPKLYLPWEKIPELVLKEQEALSTVKFGLIAVEIVHLEKNTKFIVVN